MEDLQLKRPGTAGKGRAFRIFVIAVLILCLIGGTAVAVGLGLHFFDIIMRDGNMKSYLPLIGFSYLVTFGGAEFIGITLLLMMLTLDRDPFVRRNVLRLRAMGFVALGMTGAIGLLRLVPANAWLFQLGGLAIGVCGLLSLVMAELFGRAVACKQENDLTV